MRLRKFLCVLTLVLLAGPIFPALGQLSSCQSCYSTGVPNNGPLNPGAGTFPVKCCYEFENCEGGVLQSGMTDCSVQFDEGSQTYYCRSLSPEPCEGGYGPGSGDGHCTISVGQSCPIDCGICWTRLY